MKDLTTANRKARELFGAHVMNVTACPDWKGCNSYRVTMPGNVIHWMSKRGRHESEFCCPTAKQRQGRMNFDDVEVVRR